MKIYAEAGGEARVGSDVVAGPAEAMVATAAVPVQAPTITSIKKRTEEDKLGIIAGSKIISFRHFSTKSPFYIQLKQRN